MPSGRAKRQPDHEPVVFFLDRGLGRHVLANALRDAGHVVLTMVRSIQTALTSMCQTLTGSAAPTKKDGDPLARAAVVPKFVRRVWKSYPHEEPCKCLSEMFLIG